MTEQELLVDCLRRLNDCQVPYFLTGSMASNFWGVPRSTHDLDFVVQLRAESIPPLVQAFAGDFFIQESAAHSALRPPNQFNAIDQRSNLKVDFWVLADDPFSMEMFGRRQSVVLFGARAWIASAEDVLLHKLYWNIVSPSDRQLLDAAGVWCIQEKNLDLTHLSKWARELKVEEVLEKIRRGEIKPKSS
jgi:hypothetical protein